MTAQSTISLPMSLRPRDGAAAKPSAWLLLSDDPSLWLAEICQWGIALDSLRLLVLPKTAIQSESAGVLVIASERLAASIAPSAMAQPYIAVGARLYIPAGTQLHPPLSDAELRDLLPLDVNVMHPSVGLIGCREEELGRVADFIVAPPAGPDEWTRAVEGVLVEPRLVSVKPKTLPSFEQIINESRGDIGTDLPSNLDPLPEESLLRRAAMTGMSGAFGAIDWLARQLNQISAGGASSSSQSSQQGASGAGWLSRFQGWTAEQLAALRAALESARHREMSRLIKMLESDPDKGLKYAPPLSDGGASRGMAFPGWRLGLRNINFSLGGLFRSGPADAWNSSAEAHRKLAQKYRELATRELQLRRYRRAAYIFGQLLRDLHAAASALKQGGFYREAAVIYRDRLKNKPAAAECLEQGGLLVEAIELYESIGQWEHAGDLYRKLDQEEGAERSYRRALTELEKRGEILASAALLEKKLRAPQEALDVLTRAWPGGPMASSCLAESFRLLDRMALHDEAAKRVASLRAAPPGDQQLMLPLATVLADLAATYPTTVVQTIAADATRVVAGLRLASAPDGEVPGLLSAVKRVTAGDRLLQRDAERYLADVMKRRATPKPARKALHAPQPTRRLPALLRAFQLTPGAQWLAAISTGSEFYAQGVVPVGVVITYGDWQGKIKHFAWTDPQTDETPYRLHFVPAQGLIPLAPGSATGRLNRIPTQSQVFVPPNLPSGSLFDIQLDEEENLWVLHTDEDQGAEHLLVSAYNLHGELRSSRFVTDIDREAWKSPPALSVRSGKAAVVLSNRVELLGESARTIELRDPVVSVVTSPMHTRWRAVVCFEDGCGVVWPAELRAHYFASDVVDPVACILREGMVVVAARGMGLIYEISGFEVQLIAKFSLPERPPIGVVQTHNAAEFAIFYSDGLVQVMRTS